MRAVAVLGVVLFHAEVPGVGGGYVGVDVFFVISGFLITGLLWREVSTAGTVRLRRFYGARARRLLPASATVGVITVIASAVLLPPLQARTVFGDGIASALYVGNYWFILQAVDYFTAVLPSPFQHYWSLGVEEQFYLVWPPLIIGTAWLIRRVRRRNKAEATSSERPYLVVLALVAAVSFALSLATTYVVPSVAFFSLPTRAWQLAVGGLVALTAGQWRRLPATFAAIAGWAGLALILLSCTLLSTTTPYPGIAALWPVLGRGAGDRRRLRRTCSRIRPRAGVVTDAGDRPGVLLVVSVALARAAARTALAGPPAGAGRQAGGRRCLRRAGGAHPASHRKPVAIRLCSAPVSGPQSCAGRCRHRGSGVCGSGAAGVGAHPGRPRRTGRAADRHGDCLPPRATTSTLTTRRCSTRSPRCRGRSRPPPT